MSDYNNLTADERKRWQNWIWPFIVCLLCMSGLQMANFGFSPSIPAIRESFGLSYTQIGLFTGIGGITATLMALPGGAIVKKYSEKKMMLVGVGGIFLGMVLLATSTGFIQLMSGRIVWQGFYRIAFICVMTGVAMTTPQEIRSTMMGVVGAMSCVGVAFGAPLGASVEQTYGWQMTFITYGGIGLVFAVIHRFVYHRVQIPPAPLATSEDSNAPKAKSAFKTPVVWALALLMFFGSMASLTVVYFVPTVLKTVFNQTAVQASYVISMGYTIGIFSNLAAGWVTDHYNKWVVLASIAAIQAVCAVCLALGGIDSFRIAAMIAMALGLCIPNQVYSVGGIIMKGRDVGPIMGVVGFGSGCASFVGPQVLGILRDATGGFTAGWFFLVAISCCFVIEVILLNFFNQSAKDVATNI